MDQEHPTVMLYQIQSPSLIPSANRTLRDTPTTHHRTTESCKQKKTGANEKDVVSIVERKDISPMTAMRRKMPRNVIGNGTKEGMEDQEELKGMGETADPITPRGIRAMIQSIQCPILQTTQDLREYSPEPSKHIFQSMATKRKPCSIQEPWETT